jgi:hypothetical protein
MDVHAERHAVANVIRFHGAGSIAGYGAGFHQREHYIPTLINASRFDSMEEPDALAAHVRICAGGASLCGLAALPRCPPNQRQAEQ